MSESADHPTSRTDFFELDRELMQRLARDGQAPGTMFVTCSDSRVVPEFLAGARPGDLFVQRNVANIVPPFGAGEVAVGAALEYAILRLRVSNLVVCGHLDCTGIRSLDQRPDMAAEPNLVRWLEWARPAQTSVDALNVTDPEKRHARIVEANVLLQLANLQSYNAVRKALQADRLELYGWVYEIGTGRIRSYDPSSGTFVPGGQQL